MWTYKNDYYAVVIIAFPTKETQTNIKTIEEKSRDGSKKPMKQRVVMMEN